MEQGITTAEGTASREKLALDDTLLDLLARANHLLGKMRYQVRRQGHCATEWRVLAALSAHDGVGMNELADLALFKQSSLTKAIDRLERAELVERTHTGRRTLVHLTKRGRHIAAPLLQRAQLDSSSVDRLLGEAKSRELKAALASLIIRLEQSPSEERPGDGT